MYFAILAPVVTFGGLLAEATENHISVIEALVGGMAVGVAYGLFSGIIFFYHVLLNIF